MHRPFVAFSLGMTLLAFSGCWGASEEADDSTDYETITLEGELQSLSNASVADNVTHLFRSKDDIIYYAYSEEADLSDLQWVDAAVEITGELIPGEAGSKDVIRIETIVLAEGLNDEDVPVEMVLYQNSDLGFATRYQNDWTVEESTRSVSFFAPDAEGYIVLDSIEFSRRDNLQNLEIEEWFLAYVTTEVGAPYELSAVSPDQIPSIEVEDGTMTTYYVQDVDQVLVVSFESVQSDLATEHLRLFNEMLYSLDLLSDGVRETTTSDSEGENASDGEEAEEAASQLSELHEKVMSRLGDDLDGFIEEKGSWTPTQYSFVDPYTVYVEYADSSAGTTGRLLFSYNDALVFTVLATFESGDFTDWELVSGEDVSKGQSALEYNVETGSTSLVPEGYRSMESSSMSFQLAYPAAWYYARSGDFYYFSDESADASNALVTLQLVSGQSDYSEAMEADRFVVTLPRDEAHHFLLYGAIEIKETLLSMAQSFVVLP